MRRRTALLAWVVVLASAAPASAHLGRPGYAASVEALTPRTPGLTVRVLGGDDQLEVVNRTGTTVTVLGTADEPYLRFARGRAVAVNVNAPTFYPAGAVPATASASAAPRWQTVATNGRYAWHDARIRGATGPWRVPLRVGAGRRAAVIAGTLKATGGSRGDGTVKTVALFAVPLLLVGAAALILDRRAAAPAAEAW